MSHISTGCIKPFFPNAKVIRFHNGDRAYEYLSVNLQRFVGPDLIITDINHLGIAGHKFVQAVRILESEYGYPRPIPIIILSFASSGHQNLKQPGMASAVLEKCADISEIVEAMECALYDRMEIGG
ncbi:MAG: response regulator [Chitinophagaceae bacterium]|nr:MAG: response regulator [Chitinophagaceae bacterium]